VCEYAPVIREIYGDRKLADYAGDGDAYLQVCTLLGELSAPQINSIPIWQGEDNVIPGFRFMGRRFTIDATIMQNLIYQNVGENESGEKRMLPDVLDVPAALGSDTALSVLEEQGATDYEGYSENMEKLRTAFDNTDETLWSASLYAGWLNTLRPILEEKGEGYPAFMQSEEWSKKNLETFAGSYTELKHDTILYAKQVMAEMGGGDEIELDDRGYVEPEPVVYERFAALARETAQGLSDYGMISDADAENLGILADMADQLCEISKKELANETLTDEEYELIRCYGGNIEHLWVQAMQEELGTDEAYTGMDADFPAALVVDIATNPDGNEVLEAATGNPTVIYVLVEVDGVLKLARGSVYQFYQFTVPSNERMTDIEWRVKIGAAGKSASIPV